MQPKLYLYNTYSIVSTLSASQARSTLVAFPCITYLHRCICIKIASLDVKGESHFASKQAIFNPAFGSTFPFIVVGSSTACVMILDRSESVMRAANIGDSGYMVVRGGRVVHRSHEQQHYFNTPYQLSLPPPGHDRNVLSDR